MRSTSPLIAIPAAPLPLRLWYNRLLKRALDLSVGLVLLLLTWPIMLGIACAIRLGSPGAVIFTQERISRDGVFTMYKFRTMVADAEQSTGPVWATHDDQRVTPLGHFLRRSSLDELPQLVNIIKGDMSLVGPRPERPFFVEQFSARLHNYSDRHLVKSGLTGWAQVNGMRGDTSIEARTRLDLYYVENWSLLLDVRIIFLSIYVVLHDYWCKKAY